MIRFVFASLEFAEHCEKNVCSGVGPAAETEAMALEERVVCFRFLLFVEEGCRYTLGFALARESALFSHTKAWKIWFFACF